MLSFAEALGHMDHSISFTSNHDRLHNDFKENMDSLLDTVFSQMFDFLESSSLNFHPILDNHSHDHSWILSSILFLLPLI